MRVALNHPELVRKLVLVSATAGDGSDEPWAWRRVLGKDAPQEPATRREDILQVSSLVWRRSLADPAAAAKLFAALPDKKWKVSIDRYNAMPKDAVGMDLRPKLEHLRAPTLILHGRKDPIVPDAAAEQMRERLPNSEVVYFEKSGHFPMLEEASKFQTVLEEFLSRD
jgi:pimeloyl-ACP methyl ester carboxylesterase